MKDDNNYVMLAELYAWSTVEHPLSLFGTFGGFDGILGSTPKKA